MVVDCICKESSGLFLAKKQVKKRVLPSSKKPAYVDEDYTPSKKKKITMCERKTRDDGDERFYLKRLK